MKPYLFTPLLWLIHVSVTAQRTCATEEYIKQHFVLRTVNDAVQNKLPARDTFPNEIITIPVVVHVLFNNADQNISTEQVLSQLEVLNKDFRLLNTDKALLPDAFKTFSADARIMFCLAKVDPDGRATTGINRKYTKKEFFSGDDGMKFSSMGGVNNWDTERYLNIWVCRMFGRVLGYATPPGGDITKDGLVINYDVFGTTGKVRASFNKGRTTTHEVAHWLGLKHIWGDVSCGDDEVEDTPRQKSYNFGCPSFPRTTDCSPNANGDMYMNYMDLTDDACMNMFTQGQKSKMRSIFSLKGSRNSFLRSYQCDASLATSGPLPEDSIPVKVPADLIQIFPNPVKDYITIQSKQLPTLQGKTARILTMEGKPVFIQQLKTNNEKIKLGHLSPGIYLLSIGDGNGKRSFKIVKM
jgi:hypothetical protein